MVHSHLDSPLVFSSFILDTQTMFVSGDCVLCKTIQVHTFTSVPPDSVKGNHVFTGIHTWKREEK